MCSGSHRKDKIFYTRMNMYDDNKNDHRAHIKE